MVASKDISQRNFNSNFPGPTFKTAQQGTNLNAVGQDNIQGIISPSAEGEFSRQMVTWRTPHLGYIQMYINPQSISIQEGKDISANRTKAGFIIQYAGEKLTKISINGTTGTAGMEGINILEQIYRAEQFAFEPIAEALDRTADSAELLALFKGSFSAGSAIGDAIDSFLSLSAADATLDVIQQPFPTLASLAASVEMFFQGVTYRGFFEGFRVEEKASSPGHFDYSMEFTSYAKQGVRRNFMPWHKQPYAPADWNGLNNMSFYGPPEGTVNQIRQATQDLPESSRRKNVGDTNRFPYSVNGGTRPDLRRDTSNGIGSNGQSINDLDLRDVEV